MREFSQNFNFNSVVSEAEQAGLKLLDDRTLNEKEIPGCMLAWFSFGAEFYRGTKYWFVRGDIDNTSNNRQILKKYFDEENIIKKEDGRVFYKGSLNTQEHLTDFVSNIKTIIQRQSLFQSPLDNDLIPRSRAL